MTHRTAGRTWFLPRQLNRKFTFREKLATWIFGEYKRVDGKTLIRPYALAKKFNEFGYTQYNPYLYCSYFGKVRYLIEEEERYGPTVCKSPEAAELYADEMERVAETVKRLKVMAETRFKEFK